MGSSTTTPHVFWRGVLRFVAIGVDGCRVVAGLVFASCLLSAVATVRALDTRVDAETVYQGYEVGVPYGHTSWVRRRFAQRLALELSSELGSSDSGSPPSRFAGSFDLRLLQEFGEVCTGDVGVRRCFTVTRPALSGRYVPLASDTRLQLRTAAVSLSGGPLGAIGQMGRHLYLDPIGMLRTDGLSLQFRPANFMMIKMVAGALVRGVSVAGLDAFAGVGVARAPTSAEQSARRGWLDSPTTTWLSGIGAVVGKREWVEGTVFLRDLRDRTGALQRSLSFGLISVPGGGVSLSSSAVMDGFSWDVVRGRIEIAWAGTGGTLRLRGTRDVPRYDYSSIWSFFSPAPTWAGELGYETRLGRTLRGGGRLRTRLMVPLDGARLHDVGGDVFLASTGARLEWDVSSSVIAGDNPLLYTVDGGLAYRLNRGVVAYGRVGAYRIFGTYAGARPGVSMAQQLGVTFPLQDVTEGRIELAHASGGGVQHRLSVNAVLQLKVFR